MKAKECKGGREGGREKERVVSITTTCRGMIDESLGGWIANRRSAGEVRLL